MKNSILKLKEKAAAFFLATTFALNGFVIPLAASTTAWDTDASDGVIDIACKLIQHWWFPVFFVVLIIWGICKFTGNEKGAEVFKKAIFSVLVVFIASYGKDVIINSVEAFAGLFGSATT